MKPTELRIGNYIAFDDLHGYISIERVVGINYLTWLGGKDEYWLRTENFEGELLSGFQPIPLTEEWLKKFGFEITYDSEFRTLFFHAQNDKISYRFIKATNESWLEYYGGAIDCRYAHQLQNLYFALTGEELKK